jgi:hypothetical protein
MYTETQLRTFCELAMFNSMKDLIQNYKRKTKFANSLKKIKRAASKQLATLPPLDRNSERAAYRILDAFGKATGWLGRKTPPASMFCFCLRLLENSEYVKSPAMENVMLDLLFYMEEGDFVSDESFIEGDIAYSKWLGVFGEIDEDALKQEDICYASAPGH